MSPASPREVRLAVVGHGWVGRALDRLLATTRGELAARHGVAYRVTLVATRRGGILLDPWGVSSEALDSASTAAREAPDDSAVPGRLLALLADPSTPYDVLVELTTASPEDGQPAAGYLTAALASGRDAVTANKAPVAWHAAELRRSAQATGARLRYEAAVMDCLPVLAVRSAIVPVGPISGFAGIVNSTTNHILTEMAGGRDRDAALGQARQEGIAEADPEHDLSGADAALKATILANLLLEPDTLITPAAVERQGIATIDPGWPVRAAHTGHRVKLVARGTAAAQAGGAPRVAVAPEELPLSDGLARIDGTSMGLRIDSVLGGRLDLVSTSPGVEHTAYAVLMDLLALGRERAAARPGAEAAR